MFNPHPRLFFFSVTVLTLFFPLANVLASSSSQAIPPDYSTIIQDAGVALYQKNDGSANFIQMADLSQGASVNLLHGEISDPGTGQGVYGGDNPTFSRQSINAVWNGLSSNSDAFCVTNGGFFSTNPDPAPLAFPLKQNGIMISDGYGLNEFIGEKLILEIWDDRVDIIPLTRESLYQSSAPNILAGLSEDADKGLNQPNFRTFAGITDQNNDGKYETVLIFTSTSATQAEAAQALRNFGAGKVIMLDGGGSTQFVCKGGVGIPSSAGRTIPQTIVIFRKAVPALAAEILQQPKYPVLVEGDSLSVEVQLKNAGLETWLAGETRLENIKNTFGAADSLPLPNDVEPGQAVSLAWKTLPFSKWGIYTTEWQLVRNAKEFADRVTITVIVIPKQLADQKKALEEQIKQWLNEQVQNIQEKILAWIQQQVNNTAEQLWKQICPSAALLPLLVLGGWSGTRRRR